MFDRIVALIWGGAAVAIGFMALQIALGPKGDASGWVLAGVFAAVAAFCGWQGWRDWTSPARGLPSSPPGSPSPSWRREPPVTGAVPLETQIDQLAAAGLTMARGRTIEELLQSWSRQAYEADPWNLLLFMYGSEVEAEPWGRVFCERGWNLDMECLAQAGDYGRALAPVVRTTGRPNLVTNLTDDFDIGARSARIRYEIGGRPRQIEARVDNDWADPQAVTAFLRDVEAEIGDDRRFWAADNGQASVLFFVTGVEAGAVNALCPGLLERYTGA